MYMSICINGEQGLSCILGKSIVTGASRVAISLGPYFKLAKNKRRQGKGRCQKRRSQAIWGLETHPLVDNGLSGDSSDSSLLLCFGKY